jgi:hypothetical protein
MLRWQTVLHQKHRRSPGLSLWQTPGCKVLVPAVCRCIIKDEPRFCISVRCWTRDYDQSMMQNKFGRWIVNHPQLAPRFGFCLGESRSGPVTVLPPPTARCRGVTSHHYPVSDPNWSANVLGRREVHNFSNCFYLACWSKATGIHTRL